MTTNQTPLRRLAAGAGALALALMGAVGFAGTAQAAPGPGQPGADTEGSLTIHKHAGSPSGEQNNGTVQDVDRPPLGGVPFTVTRQGTVVSGTCTAVDLTTAAGWDTAQAIIAGTQTPCTTGLFTDTLSTNPSGVAEFDNLALGLYHVTEGAVDFVETPAAPFFVTIPYRSDTTTADGWRYDVHVYPKNTIDSPSDKTVTAPLANGQGSTVTWTIQTRPLGSFNNGQPLSAYSVFDTLDSRLAYVAASASLTMNLPSGATATIPAYTLAEPTGAGGTLTVTFTDLAALNALPAGTSFELTFDTTVDGAGDINNEAFEDLTGDASDPDSIGSASTQWGPAQVLKHQTGNIAQGLDGAVFSVYKADTNGTCTGTLGSIVEVNGETEFTSKAGGIVTIAGLWVGTDGTTASRTYCVVEVAPPAGYLVDATPRPIVVKAEGTATTTASIQVANTPVPGPILPLTGAEGTMLFTLAGVALVAVAGGGFLVRRARASR
ncbi:MAG: SpaH/EbpB family LPXTG-anchored major pilin [Propionicimonas sp.]